MSDINDLALISIADAAELASVSKSTIRRAIERGDLVRVQLTPALVRVTAESLGGWIAGGMEIKGAP